MSNRTIAEDLIAGNPTLTTKLRKKDDLLYEKVASILRDEIANGVHPVGSLLPTEAKLRERFAVSRHTIREALRTLRTDRLVSSRQGAGTIVEPARHADEFVLNATSINDLLSYSSAIWLKVDSVGMEKITGEQAARTGIAEGEKWLVARGFVVAEGNDAPVCWAEHFIAPEFAPIADLLPRHRAPVFRLIEEAMDEEIVEIEQEMSGALVPEDLAAGLRVEPASAAIEVKRIYTTAKGRIAQVTVHLHPASRFRYSSIMRRPRG